MMQAKVSVIVPVYNVALYLQQYVESIQNQTLGELEIILIDDGSSDGSSQMCDQFASTDKQVRVVHQKNAGVSAARNLGIEMAKAEWIMFVDGDDWLEPNAVELLYQKSLTIPCEIVAGSRFRNYVGKQVKEGPDIGKCFVFSANKWGKYLLGAMLTDPYVCPQIFPAEMKDVSFLGVPWAKIYRRSIIMGNKITFLENIAYAEDRMFNIDMISVSAQICILTDPIYHYRARASSACNVSVEGRYLNTNGRALIDHITLYEGRIDKVFIQKYAMDCILSCISLLSRDIKKLSVKQSVSILTLFLKQHPICEQSICVSDYQIMTTKKQQFKLWLLKHRMYRVLILLQALYNNVTMRRNQLEFYP